VVKVEARRNLGGRTGGKVSEEARSFDQPPEYLHP
jgi:hypothetical protein